MSRVLDDDQIKEITEQCQDAMKTVQVTVSLYKGSKSFVDLAYAKGLVELFRTFADGLGKDHPLYPVITKTYVDINKIVNREV